MKLFLILIFILIPSLSFSQTLNNCRVTTASQFGATSVPVVALANKANRRCLSIQNTSSGTSAIYIKFSAAGAITDGISLTPGSMWAPYVIPMNAIYINSNALVGTSTVLIQGE